MEIPVSELQASFDEPDRVHRSDGHEGGTERTHHMNTHPLETCVLAPHPLQTRVDPEVYRSTHTARHRIVGHIKIIYSTYFRYMHLLHLCIYCNLCAFRKGSLSRFHRESTMSITSFDAIAFLQILLFKNIGKSLGRSIVLLKSQDQNLTHLIIHQEYSLQDTQNRLGS